MLKIFVYFCEDAKYICKDSKISFRKIGQNNFSSSNKYVKITDLYIEIGKTCQNK